MSSRRSSSPPSRPPSTRSPNLSAQNHVPLTPSGLREAHTLPLSPEDTQSLHGQSTPSSTEPSPRTQPAHGHNDPDTDDEETDGSGLPRAVTETTSLLRRPFELVTKHVHDGPCNHGTFSPGLESRAESTMSEYGFGRGSNNGESSSLLGSLLENIGVKTGSGSAKKKKMSRTDTLVERHGIKNKRTMYVLRSYYT